MKYVSIMTLLGLSMVFAIACSSTTEPEVVIQEVINRPLPIGEFDFFAICVLMFLGGGVMTFTPKLKFAFHIIE